MDLICFILFNATFSNISTISWRPVLVVKEAGEDHQPRASNCRTVKHVFVRSLDFASVSTIS
jgi:hypothetical protein